MTFKNFLNTLADYLMLRTPTEPPTAPSPFAPETNAAHIVTPITIECGDCGAELTPVIASEHRGAHYRHAKGRTCRPKRVHKEKVNAGN